MPTFSKQKINTESEALTSILRQIRHDKKISLEKAAQHLQINIKYLQALESGDFKKLPPGVYGKNFLREYSLFLGLNPDEMSDLFSSSTDSKSETKKDPFSRKVPKSHYFLTIPKLIKNILISLVIIICFTYLFFSLKNIVAAPEVTIIYPANDITINTRTLTIQGKAEKETEILINDELSLLDQDGFFSKEINLKNGLNTIIIVGQKKYSRENRIIRNIIVNPQNQ